MEEVFKGIDGIVVPGGFGNRGVEGKIRAVQYARENNVPYLGLCWVCSVLSWNSPATSSALKALRRRNSMKMQNSRSSTHARPGRYLR